MASLDELIEILIPDEPKTYGKFPSVTSVIKMAGFDMDYDAIPPDVMEKARQRGTVVHKACEYVDNGELDYDTLDPAIKGFVDGHFLFLKECHVTALVSESTVIDEELRIGGTPDVYCYINGELSIVDRKTGAFEPESPCARLQTAGYAILKERQTKRVIPGRFIEKLFANGTYKLIRHPHNDIDRSAFLDVVEYAASKRKRDSWIRHFFLGGKTNASER